MQYIPFPPAITRISARNAKKSYENEKLNKTTPRERTNQGFACYRTEDGLIRMAYDLYRPEYPAGATPGLGSVKFTPAYSVNGFEGYDSTAYDFVPAAEILRSNPLSHPGRAMDRTGALAIALIQQGSKSAFAWALDEAQMNGWTEYLPQAVKVTRPHATLHGMDDGAVPACAVMIETLANRECHIGGSREALATALSERLGFLKLEAMPLPDMVKLITDHGNAHGWKVYAQIEGEFEPHPIYSGPAHRISALNADLKQAFGINTPHAVLVRGASQIEIGAIEFPGAEPIVLWASDAAALSRQISNALNEITGSTLRHGDHAGDVSKLIAKTLAETPGLTVRTGRGSAHMAYGAEPRELVLATEKASGHCFGIAASTQDVLCQMVMRILAPEAETCDVDDLEDAMFKVQQADKFSMIAMSEPDREALIGAMRAAVSRPHLLEMS